MREIERKSRFSRFSHWPRQKTTHLLAEHQAPCFTLAARGLEEHLRITLNYFSWYYCFTIFVVKLLYSLSFNLKTPDQSSSLRYFKEFLIHDSHRMVTIGITPSTRVPPATLKINKSHNPQATGQNKSKNCGPTTRRIDSAAVGRIKGIPIHPPEGSCSGYPLIPYSAASDACSRRCVNPAAK